MITHYINDHHYQPPAELVEAVMTCPNTRTPEYKQLMIASSGQLLVARLP